MTLPSLGRPIHVGYFYRDTAAIQYGGDNPGAPATCSVIVDPLAIPAEAFEGREVRMIVSADCLFGLASYGGRFNHLVDAVYVSAEHDRLGLERQAETVRLVCSRLGHPAWPILSYTAGSLYPAALHPQDILGVQAYAEVGELAGDFLLRIERDLALVRHRRVALICQAYDRAQPAYWTPDRVAALQPVYWALAADFPNIEYILLFSDGRRGGVRDLGEPVRAWHRAMVAASGH